MNKLGRVDSSEMASKKALEFSEYLTAQRWAVSALMHSPKKYKNIYKENLKTINWIINNKDLVQTEFRITNYD